jgi:hypothetical protein
LEILFHGAADLFRCRYYLPDLCGLDRGKAIGRSVTLCPVGVEIGRAAIANPQVVLPLNDHVFSALQGTDVDGHLRWIQVTARGKEGSSESLFLAAQKSGLPTEFLTKTTQVITPGTTIIFTDKPVDPTTQSHTGFQIVVAQKDKQSGTAE